MFTFHHPVADLHFSWDGWMQIRIRPGDNVAHGLFPDRFDIREPDLRDPLRRPHPSYPGDGSVHFVPETQKAFESLCDTWWRGGETCVGLRDYARDPWESRSWGPTVGAFRFRYLGGTHIDAAPGEIDAWRPMIAIADDNRTPATLSTAWLMDRTFGWQLAWLAAHDIGTGHDDDVYDGRFTWAAQNLPAPGPKGSLAGQFHQWITEEVIDLFTGETWLGQQNLGHEARYVSAERPVTTTGEALDGTRWNFTWLGRPYAIVWSPDRRLSYAEHHFAKPPPVTDTPNSAQRWLEAQAESWLREYDRSGQVPPTAIPQQ